ncbi:GNAT family N-acetyltransferase [Prolixibacteraceae bacterium Z1-6]|uniref:GNAT family N-acetyltransferase n=1 Tax=Draconibacterium aestuarii TaxID=2998507 RepID=A0A9X3FIS0_9BACT|nr:GNAT family N-acetyltransferase [Prolixibacteraceae bacterium Z1-6]
MSNKTFVQVDLANPTHCNKLLELLNDYMEDEMGISQSMPVDLGPKIIEGLKKHPAYLGFFVCVCEEFAALANCNLNYSTWTAKFLINIHDFIVSPASRKQGVGEFLLNEIENYAKEKDYCKVNLEVRNDNFKAQNLYKKVGYSDCVPSMFFWQKRL